jgi:hypothetical protein
MSDVYQSVSHRSLGDNLIDSIKGFLVGILLFFAAFPILWMNEGCTDMSEVAKTAVVVKADSPGAGGEGKLIAVTADLKVDEPVGDPAMLAPGAYAKLHRKVEMYAWKEKKETTNKKKLGGGTDVITTYTYDTVWTENPQSTESFSVQAGHQNPTPSIHGEDFYPTHAKVGAFTFAPHDAELPPATPLALTAAMVIAKAADVPAPVAPTPAAPAAPPKPGKIAPKKGGKPAPVASTTPATTPGASAASDAPASPGSSGFRLVDAYLFRGRGSVEQPKLGDVRVSYDVVLPGKQVTLYGKRTGSTVVAFVNEKGDKLFRAVPGTHEQAIAQLHGEHVTQTWIVRVLGFLAMWVGLGLVLGPINSVLDIVPFIGSAGRFVTGIAMFPVALVLSAVTIVVAIIAHSTILLVLTIVLFVGGLTALILVKRKNAPPAQPQPAGGPPMGYAGPPQGGYGPPQGGYGPPQGGYGPPQGGYGPPQGGGGYGPPPGGGGYGPPPGGGGYGPPQGGGGPPPGGGGYGPQGGGGQ